MAQQYIHKSSVCPNDDQYVAPLFFSIVILKLVQTIGIYESRTIPFELATQEIPQE